jgi:hypothetical protein
MPKGYFVILQLNKIKRLALRAFLFLANLATRDLLTNPICDMATPFCELG